jgi:hypothetical protein
MLDSDDREQAVATWIYSLPCHVAFPAHLRANFERTGPAPAVADDVRSCIRIHCCGKSHRAAMEVRQSLPAFQRETAWHSIYTTNISKKGCGFFHSELLYPGERFSLILLKGIQQVIEVAWCRRLDPNCFAVGARFLAGGVNSLTGK